MCRTSTDQPRPKTGISPSLSPCYKGLRSRFWYPDHTSWDYNSGKPQGSARFQSWALPTSLAATEGILVSFFSSAYWDASIQRVLLPHLRSNAKKNICSMEHQLVEHALQSPNSSTSYLDLSVTEFAAQSRARQILTTQSTKRRGQSVMLHCPMNWHTVPSNLKEPRTSAADLQYPKPESFEIVVFDSQRGMVSVSQDRRMRSKFRWFTEFCNSHYVSQFAAFFIVARA